MGGRSYPVADSDESKLSWQTIAMRHAWKHATQRDWESLTEEWDNPHPATPWRHESKSESIIPLVIAVGSTSKPLPATDASLAREATDASIAREATDGGDSDDKEGDHLKEEAEIKTI